MGFFDGLKKANATIGTIGAGLAVGGVAAAAIAKGVSSFKKAKHSREMDNKKYELELEKMRAENELKIKTLDQKERSEVLNAQVSVQKQQMNNDNVLAKMQIESSTNIQLANINNQASVQKAQLMYGNNGVNTSGMIVDKENGFVIDNRQPNLQIVNGVPQMYSNFDNSLMFTPQQPMINNVNMETIQRKLLNANELRKSGAITENEFLVMKQKILNGSM